MSELKRPLVTVVGLGPGSFGDLTLDAFQSMQNAAKVLVRTSQHPAVAGLSSHGIAFETLDAFYAEGDDFEAVYRAMVARIIETAQRTFSERRDAGIVYAVPGSPHVGERSVELLVEVAAHAEVDVSVLPAVSFLETVCSSAGVDPFSGLQVVDALSIDTTALNTSTALVVPQIYDRMVAGAVKSRLGEVYPDEHEVVLVRAVRTSNERVERMHLYEIDRATLIDHLTTLIVPALPTRVDVAGHERSATAFAELVSVMSALRSEAGCPWDREQTHESLKKYMIEETYEALDTIDQGDMDKLCEELGDVMLQTVFHAQIAKERGDFDAADVVSSIVEKLIRRHPHVFGDVEVDGSEAVLRNWEKIKATERGEKGRFSRVFDSIPVALPALMRAERVQSKASKVGFDWEDFRPALAKVEEELSELHEALSGFEAESVDHVGGSSMSPVREELGDLLFAVVNVARLLSIDPEDALKRTVDKFVRRFKYIEEKAASMGVSLDQMTLPEMDRIWEESKEVLQ